MSCGKARRYRQSRSPLRAFIAMTWSSGVVTNITPSFTIGGASWPDLTSVDIVQTGTRSATFSVLIWSSGL